MLFFIPMQRYEKRNKRTNKLIKYLFAKYFIVIFAKNFP